MQNRFSEWGSRGRKFESSHPDVGSDCKITSFFVFYGQFISQHLHDSTLLALGAPFPASCVHVCHFEFHCQSAYLHCFHPDNSASVFAVFERVTFFPCHVSLFSKDTAACFNKKLAYFNRLPPFAYQNIKVALFIHPLHSAHAHVRTHTHCTYKSHASENKCYSDTLKIASYFYRCITFCSKIIFVAGFLILSPSPLLRPSPLSDTQIGLS